MAKEIKESQQYINGYDAGYNGANTTNCHFSNFSNPDKMKKWQRGNNDGSHQRELDQAKSKLPQP